MAYMGLASGFKMNEYARQLYQAGVRHLYIPGRDLLADQGRPRPGEAQKEHPHQTKKDTPSEPRQAKPLAFAEMPMVLRKLIKPCPVLWTYFEFMHDLFEEGDPARQKLIRKIISSLHEIERWPVGSSTFWPVSRRKGQNLVPDPAFFLSGVDKIKPLYLFCFGPRSLAALCPDKKFDFKPFNLDNLRIQPLPSISSMLHSPEKENKKNKIQTWNILKGYSRFLR